MVGLFLPVLVLWYWGFTTLLRTAKRPVGVGVAGSPMATGQLPSTWPLSTRLMVRLPNSRRISRVLV